MSEFSVKNQNNISVNNFPNSQSVPQTENQNLPDKNLKEGEALHDKIKVLQQTKNNSTQDIRSHLMQLEQSISSKGGSESLLKEQKLFFLTNLDNTIISNVLNKEAPHLMQLQMKAGNCDLAFKEKCLYLLDGDNGLNTQGNIYKGAKTSDQKAFLDLMFAFKFTSAFCTEFAKQNQSSADTKLQQHLQGLMGELFSCEAKDVDSAKSKLLALLDKLPENEKTKGSKALNEFKNKLNAIAQNKKAVATQLKQLHGEYKQAVSNLKSVNPDTIKFTELNYNKASQSGGVPSMCGINAMLEGEELRALKKEIDHDFKPKIDELKKLSKDIDLTLKADNLKGLTISNLQKRLEDAGDNTALQEKLEAHSQEAFEEIGGRIISLLENPVSNYNLSSELTKIGDMISRDLTEEHSKSLAKTFSHNLAKLTINGSSPESTQNLKALKSLFSKISSSEDLLKHFTSIIQTLTLNNFDLKSLAALGGAKEGDADEVIAEKTTEIIEKICKVLDGKENGPAFIDALADNLEYNEAATTAFLSVASVLSESKDELLAQKCGKYMHLNLIKQAAMLDLQKSDLQHWSVPPTPEEFKANPKKYEDFSLKLDLVKLLNGKPSEFNADLFKSLLEGAAQGKLKHLRTIWNTVLGAAYHAEMASKLEKKEISNVPRQIYSISAQESSPDLKEIAPKNYTGENARADFNNSLSDNVKNLMKGQAQGLFRKESQTKIVDKITDKLNSLNSSTTLKAMSYESMAGKKMLCLEEMRKELMFINESILKKGTKQYRDISDADQLLQTSIDKAVLVDAINTNYKGISDKYSTLMKEKSEALQNPALSQLLEAQGLEPGDIPKGEDVAVTLVTLRDHLVDDLDMLDDRALKDLGIQYPEKLRLSPEVIEYGQDLNKYLAKQHMLFASGITNPPADPKFSEEKIAEFEKTCDEALNVLKDKLTEACSVKPLSKTAQLLLNKYVQIAALRHGDSYSQFVAKDAGTAYLQKHGDSKDSIKHAQQLTFEENIKICSKISALGAGDLKTQDKDLVAIEKLILNDLSSQLGFNEDEEKALYDAVSAGKLSQSEKKELLNSMKLTSMNVNLDSFTVSDPRFSEKTTFSNDLRNLAHAQDNEFDEKLKNFTNSYLFSEKMTQADALMTYINHGTDVKKASNTALSTAISETAMKNSQVIKQISGDFEKNYGEKLGTVHKNASVISKAMSEQVETVGRKLLSNLTVRSQVRLATSYAASQLGYAGKDDLIEAYQSEKTSEEDKNKILSEVSSALNKRGFDSNLSDMLALARLGEGKRQNMVARTWTYVRNQMFRGLSFLQSKITKFFESDLARVNRKKQEFKTYLPSVTEMVNSVGKNNVKYIDNDKELKFAFNPLEATDALAATGLNENGVVSLKLALSLMNKSGMVLNRDQDGKINLAVNTTTLLGATASADVDLLEACGASAEAGANVGGGKVLNMKFASDEEAAVFICKMFTGQLNSSDVKLASEAATGTSFKAGAQISADAKIGAALNSAVFMAESPNYGAEVEDAEEEFANNHPVLDTIMGNADIGDLKLSGAYNYDTRTITDNSGILTETHRQWKVESEFSSFEFAGKYKEIADKVSDLAIEGSEIAENTAQKRDDLNDKATDLLNKPLKALGINYGENYHTVHTSDITGKIDYATDTTVTTELKDKDLEKLKEAGFINATLEKQLKDAESDIIKVSYVMKLKQSVIDRYQNDPKALTKAAQDVKKNYELISFTAELSGSEKKIESLGFKIGPVSYSSSATAKGTTLIKFEKSKL